MSKLLEFSVDYNYLSSARPNIIRLDMEYLKSRIMSNRSMNTTRLSLSDGRLYEASKTLIDVIDYTLQADIDIGVKRIDVVIDNDIDLPIVKITTKVVVFKPKVYGPFTVDFMYTMAGQKSEYGGFIVVFRPDLEELSPSTVGDVLIHEHFGVIPALDKLVGVPDATCLKSAKILSFSENFPTPSELIYNLQSHFYRMVGWDDTALTIDKIIESAQNR